uniref:Uncharacterized protein n=1 Tax=Setaria italica TaxID=4555 RepID=K4AJ23_SETIT
MDKNSTLPEAKTDAAAIAAAGELLCRSLAGVRRWSDAAAGDAVRAGYTEAVGRRRCANGPSSASSSSSSSAKLRRLAPWCLGGDLGLGTVRVWVLVAGLEWLPPSPLASSSSSARRRKFLRWLLIPARSARRDGTTGEILRSLGDWIRPGRIRKPLI